LKINGSAETDIDGVASLMITSTKNITENRSVIVIISASKSGSGQIINDTMTIQLLKSTWHPPPQEPKDEMPGLILVASVVFLGIAVLLGYLLIRKRHSS